jgi:HNH endonuclease
MITQEELKKVLHYNPKTGVFIWRAKRSRSVSIGDQAGHFRRGKGHVNIVINRRSYKAHRLAHLYMTGEWPEELDHIDGDPHNNRWENLRLCTRSQNSMNRRLGPTNTSGIKGVGWCPRAECWIAKVVINGRPKQSSHSTKEEAAAAVQELRTKLHGAFSRHT